MHLWRTVLHGSAGGRALSACAVATSCFGFERHGRGPSVREGATFLRRPVPDANRLDPCNKVGHRLHRLGCLRMPGSFLISCSESLADHRPQSAHEGGRGRFRGRRYAWRSTRFRIVYGNRCLRDCGLRSNARLYVINLRFS
jgi:hypothetical protein